MNKDLEEFNKKVIESIKKQNDEEGLMLLDLSAENIAVTKLDINGVPSLVFVKLSDEDSDKPLTDRIEGVIFALSIPNVDTYKKLANWVTLIFNDLQNSMILNQAIENLI